MFYPFLEVHKAASVEAIAHACSGNAYIALLNGFFQCSNGFILIGDIIHLFWSTKRSIPFIAVLLFFNPWKRSCVLLHFLCCWFDFHSDAPIPFCFLWKECRCSPPFCGSFVHNVTTDLMYPTLFHQYKCFCCYNVSTVYSFVQSIVS